MVPGVPVVCDPHLPGLGGGDGAAGLSMDFACRRIWRLSWSLPRILLHDPVGWTGHFASQFQMLFLKSCIPS